MDGFVATFANRLDQKGRVSVPAPFRAVLAREGQDGVYCYPALDRPAIDGGGARLQEAIAKRLEPFETFSEDYESLSTAFYGESRILKIDPDGRDRAAGRIPRLCRHRRHGRIRRPGVQVPDLGAAALRRAPARDALASPLADARARPLQSPLRTPIRARGSRHERGPHLLGGCWRTGPPLPVLLPEMLRAPRASPKAAATSTAHSAAAATAARSWSAAAGPRHRPRSGSDRARRGAWRRSRADG